ncbi:hypothetical protein [Enterococcus gilvus]|uniref:hypothetical protein n=1 Tax=Enterococcus gilvus TaxID=160453 RepID=UPI003EDB65DC
MKYKIGDRYHGKDCNQKIVSGKVIKIMERTMVIENGVERYLVKKVGANEQYGFSEHGKG